MSACSTDVEPAVVAVKEAGAGLGMALWATFQRDLVGVARRPADALTPLVFFAMVITLFPLGISPEPERLAWIAPGRAVGGGFAVRAAVAGWIVPRGL